MVPMCSFKYRSNLHELRCFVSNSSSLFLIRFSIDVSYICSPRSDLVSSLSLSRSRSTRSTLWRRRSDWRCSRTTRWHCSPVPTSRAVINRHLTTGRHLRTLTHVIAYSAHTLLRQARCETNELLLLAFERFGELPHDRMEAVRSFVRSFVRVLMLLPYSLLIPSFQVRNGQKLAGVRSLESANKGCDVTFSVSVAFALCWLRSAFVGLIVDFLYIYFLACRSTLPTTTCFADASVLAAAKYISQCTAPPASTTSTSTTTTSSSTSSSPSMLSSLSSLLAPPTSSSLPLPLARTVSITTLKAAPPLALSDFDLRQVRARDVFVYRFSMTSNQTKSRFVDDVCLDLRFVLWRNQRWYAFDSFPNPTTVSKIEIVM
jgi:hypothetical protein